MSVMSESHPSTSVPGAAAQAKPLWVAIGVLSVAVLGMGGVLINGQMTKPVPIPPVVAPVAAAVPAAAPTAPLDAPVSMQPEPKAAPAPIAKSADQPANVHAKPTKVVSKAHDANHTKTPVEVAQAPRVPPQPPQPSGSAQGSEPSAPVGVPAPVQQSAPAPVVVQVPARPVCLNCGSVESVTPVERAGSPAGIGAVAGGVLGAVVGNQVGHGSGRTAATILGAIGGGLAGNAMEKNMKKSTAYDVRVRMEDGSLRSFEQATPLSAGDKVLVDNGVLRPAPKAAAETTHTVVGPRTAPAKVYTSD